MPPSARWNTSTRTDQGPRRFMADAAHHFVHLAWAVADGVGDDWEPADAAIMAAQAAPYAALTGGAACGIARARSVLKDYYRGCPRGQEGDCVMVTAVPMSERVGGGWDFAWVGDCRAYVLQSGTLRQVTEDHTEGQEMRDWKDPYWAEIAASYDHKVTRTVLRDRPIDSVRVPGPVDLVMLCTDGVGKALPESDIRRILTAGIRPRHMTRALIAAARCRRQGTDNIAVTVITPRTPQASPCLEHPGPVPAPRGAGATRMPAHRCLWSTSSSSVAGLAPRRANVLTPRAAVHRPGSPRPREDRTP